jgi:RraA family protein
MANKGFRVFSKIERPEPALVAAFAGIPVANIADNMNRMSCIDAKIRPLNQAPLLGSAFTVRTRPGDNLLLHKAIDMAGPGDVIVVDAQGETANAITGELMILWMQRRGVAGLIVDGAVRDCGSIREMNFPVYAAGITPKGPYKDGPGEINVSVNCGGIVVNPGDILVGDQDGVVVISPREAAEILEKAKGTVEKEAGVIRSIKAGTWERTWVDQALQAKGCEFID